MSTVNVFDAKSNLSRLLADAAAGEEVIIANRGTPVARLVPISQAHRSSGMALAQWLTTNHPPTKRARSADAIAAGIAEERESWE